MTVKKNKQSTFPKLMGMKDLKDKLRIILEMTVIKGVLFILVEEKHFIY
jgi:hypothetical protein